MCLIALAWQVHPHWPLVLIANRDETHARPTAPAGPHPDAADVYGGRDLVAGGSWLLASARGRMAAVTNVRDGVPAPERPRSRGALVDGFVRGLADAPAFAAALATTAADYGRFNLLLWDGRSLHFCSNHPAFVEHAVSPGIHAMSNGAFDAPWPKAGAATQRLQAWLALGGHAGSAGQVDTEALFEALADTTAAEPGLLPDTGVGHALERFLSPVFILGRDYGTRCSTVVLAGPGGIDFEERRFGPEGAAEGGRRVCLGA